MLHDTSLVQYTACFSRARACALALTFCVKHLSACNRHSTLRESENHPNIFVPIAGAQQQPDTLKCWFCTAMQRPTPWGPSTANHVGYTNTFNLKFLLLVSQASSTPLHQGAAVGKQRRRVRLPAWRGAADAAPTAAQATARLPLRLRHPR